MVAGPVARDGLAIPIGSGDSHPNFRGGRPVSVDPALCRREPVAHHRIGGQCRSAADDGCLGVHAPGYRTALIVVDCLAGVGCPGWQWTAGAASHLASAVSIIHGPNAGDHLWSR